MVSTFRIETIKEVDINDIIKIQIECRISPWNYQDYQNEILRKDSASFTAISNHTIIGFIVARLIIQDNFTNSYLEAEIYNLKLWSLSKTAGLTNWQITLNRQASNTS